MCYDIISGQSLLTNFCSCSMLQSRWNRFVAMIVNALNPVQGTIFGSGGHMRVEQKFSDFVFCTSNRELSLQTTLIRDLRVALGHVVNPKKITGVFQQKMIIWRQVVESSGEFRRRFLRHRSMPGRRSYLALPASQSIGYND